MYHKNLDSTNMSCSLPHVPVSPAIKSPGTGSRYISVTLPLSAFVLFNALHSPEPSCHLSITSASWGDVLLPDGRVVLVPYNAKHVGLYDPSADAWTEGKDDLSAVGSDGKYVGGVLLPDGHMSTALPPKTSAWLWATGSLSLINRSRSCDLGTSPNGPAHSGGCDRIEGTGSRASHPRHYVARGRTRPDGCERKWVSAGYPIQRQLA
eukprot:COSAG01_NODE_27022_length_696_cov_1.869347_1_plen_208_part_10